MSVRFYLSPTFQFYQIIRNVFVLLSVDNEILGAIPTFDKAIGESDCWVTATSLSHDSTMSLRQH